MLTVVKDPWELIEELSAPSQGAENGIFKLVLIELSSKIELQTIVFLTSVIKGTP